MNSIIHNRKEVAFSNPHHMRVSPRWCPPPLGALKLNFDGSALGNPGPAGVGGVIRNEEGYTILSYSGPTRICSINKAELLALKIGLRKAINLHPHRLLVEGDSFCTIQWASPSSTTLGTWQILLRRLYNFRVVSIFPSTMSSAWPMTKRIGSPKREFFKKMLHISV
eukprot:TRINITY_DN3370_c1_g2_i3.p1 TRINITY_DN3370_c1_g2~~TRINITY_DN3370_c1_g2_i3.p1  ORF type:complete len:167 (+),score=20.75 TRINITY_DN3370_c1_g2_i3:1551-2051(+)